LPGFAGEAIASVVDGPDPPDVLCAAASGRRVGVELTKWVEHNQITSGKEAASALRSRKTERAAKEKPTPISQFF